LSLSLFASLKGSIAEANAIIEKLGIKKNPMTSGVFLDGALNIFPPDIGLDRLVTSTAKKLV